MIQLETKVLAECYLHSSTPRSYIVISTPVSRLEVKTLACSLAKHSSSTQSKTSAIRVSLRLRAITFTQLLDLLRGPCALNPRSHTLSRTAPLPHFEIPFLLSLLPIHPTPISLKPPPNTAKMTTLSFSHRDGKNRVGVLHTSDIALLPC